MQIVRVENLIKSYKRPLNPRENLSFAAKMKQFLAPSTESFVAVNKTCFSVNQSEVVGFLGANGSGKSTTIKILTGILTPDSGSVSVLGFTPWKQRIEYTKKIGVVMGQKSLLWWNIPVQDSLLLYRDIYSISNEKYARRIKVLSELLELGSFLHVPVRKLSLGQRMRAEVAASLVHSPELVFLDEPTIGLDPLSRQRLMSFITKINQEEGTTIFITSHNMTDIQNICPRSIIMNNAEIIFDGATEQLIDLENYKTIEFSTNCAKSIKELAYLQPEEMENSRYRIKADTDKAKDILASLISNESISNLNVMPPSLDETIKSYLHPNVEGRLRYVS